ncbi:MAG: hypothetical protein AAGI24_10170, partial [Pseudomonadota bacterium]
KHLQAWLTSAHEARGEYNERLDQRLRMSVIGIRARGYEVVLKTRAEAQLYEDLKHIQNAWNLADLEEVTANYQRALCEEQVHLDRIDPRARYEVSTITVPVFAQRQLPALCFAAGSFNKPLPGSEIETIAARLSTAASEVADVAKSHAPYEDESDR